MLDKDAMVTPSLDGVGPVEMHNVKNILRVAYCEMHTVKYIM